MVLRAAYCMSVAAAAIAVAVIVAAPAPSYAQTPPAAPAKPEAPPAPPAPQATPGSDAQPAGVFGEDTTLTAHPIALVKGQGTWDNALDTISKSLKKIRAYIDKEGLKADGFPMTIFTSVDDSGFDYQVAIPIAEAPKTAPHGDVAIGQSPEGHVLKFVHHGSYDALEDTYEAITNYLDDKRLDAQNMIIEQYETEPVAGDAKLVINIFIPIK
jgi:effector-binding domain-containing protein